MKNALLTQKISINESQIRVRYLSLTKNKSNQAKSNLGRDCSHIKGEKYEVNGVKTVPF